jgi:hypothetical protein
MNDAAARARDRAARCGARGRAAGAVPRSRLGRGRKARFGSISICRRSAETLSLADALGRVLAHDVAAPIDVPPFDRANVDGFALRAADTVGATDATPRRLRSTPRCSPAVTRRSSPSRPAPPPRSRPAA